EVTRAQNEPAASARNPYGAFARALQEGRLGTAAESEPRRRMRDVQTESGIPVQQMIALGTEDPPSRRRSVGG
ncbi:MAG TPA: hypothetical protein VFR37_09195, partial [Longimicrobium sp.]|nr:hypothetical protein [Longimicrobium sp.]